LQNLPFQQTDLGLGSHPVQPGRVQPVPYTSGRLFAPFHELTAEVKAI
jgi:hypothetical protein